MILAGAPATAVDASVIVAYITTPGIARVSPFQFGAPMSHMHLPPATEVDAVVVGAGFAGLYMLYKLRQLGSTLHANRELTRRLVRERISVPVCILPAWKSS